MATYYVTADAAGGGTGSAGSPWTLAEAAAATKAALDTVWVKAGTYGRSATLTFTGSQVRWRCYSTTEGDGGKATISATANNITLINCSGTLSLFEGFILSGSGQTGVRGISGNGTESYVYRCDAIACSNYAFFQNRYVSQCTATNCTSVSAYDWNVVVRDCMATGQNGGECAIHGRTGLVVQSVAFANNGIGLRVDSYGGYVNCVSASNGGTGITFIGAARPTISSDIISVSNPSLSAIAAEADYFIYNLFYSNAGTSNSRVTFGITNPFVNSAAGDFRLTSAAKSSVNAANLKSIMSKLGNVPGITVDSLADLNATGGCPLVGHGGLVY